MTGFPFGSLNVAGTPPGPVDWLVQGLGGVVLGMEAPRKEPGADMVGFGAFILPMWNSRIFFCMSSVRALTPLFDDIKGVFCGRLAALMLPRGVEDAVIFAVVAQSDTEREERGGGAGEVAAVGDSAIVVVSLCEALGGRNSEEASNSSELVAISDPAGLSVGIPCYWHFSKVEGSSAPGGWRKGDVG